MRIEIPELALVVLIGPAGAGKSTFAAAHFKPTQAISSDVCRALVSDDEHDQAATPAAFEVLHLVVRHRLRRGRLTVVDAVNARPVDRAPLLELARDYDVAAIALVFDLPEALCVARDASRPGRRVGARVVQSQWEHMRTSMAGLGGEGFDAVHRLSSIEAVAAAAIRRVPLAVNRRWERGPFDLVGEVRGHLGPLVGLLERLGYRIERGLHGEPIGATHPAGRKAIFIGDLVGPGPDSAGAVGLAMAMVSGRSALCVRGDLDDSGSLSAERAAFLADLPSHLVLARGALVVTHAGIRREMVGRDSARIRAYCLRGEPGWAAAYRGRALVAHGHAPVDCARWQGRTVDLDTGGGGTLTALRYPELDLVTASL